MFGGKTVAHHENIGDKAVGDSCVVDLLRAGSLGNGVAHIGIPGYGGINLLLGEKGGGLDAGLGMDGLVEDFIALVGAEARGLEPVPQQEVRWSVRRKSDFLAGQVFDAVDS